MIGYRTRPPLNVVTILIVVMVHLTLDFLSSLPHHSCLHHQNVTILSVLADFFCPVSNCLKYCVDCVTTHKSGSFVK